MGFSQEQAIELGLDIMDLCILKWLLDFSPNMKKKIMNGEEYVWVVYNKILQDYPILKISKRTLMRKIEFLEKTGFIKKLCIKQQGSFLYVKILPKMDKLLSKPDIEGVTFCHTGVTNCHNKDNSISIINNIVEEKHLEECKLVIDYLNEKANKHFKYTESNKKYIRARLNEGFSVDELKQVVDNQVSDWLDSEKMNKFLRPETLFSNKCDGYLNNERRNNDSEYNPYL